MYVNLKHFVDYTTLLMDTQYINTSHNVFTPNIYKLYGIYYITNIILLHQANPTSYINSYTEYLNSNVKANVNNYDRLMRAENSNSTQKKR